MLGNDLFKVDSKVDLSNERLKSLVLFYVPLIGNQAHYLYEFLTVKGNSYSFEEINKLLNSIGYSIDELERSLSKLNEYKLLKTLKKKNSNSYVFVLENPLTAQEFIKDDLFVRDFILKTSGLYYQSLIVDIRSENNNSEFEDVSTKFDPGILSTWSKDDETFLNKKDKESYVIDSYFNINNFLSDMSTTLFPMKFRTAENLKQIASLADLYNITADKMRVYISKAVSSTKNNFDGEMLKRLCQNSKPEYRFIEGEIYEIPCLLFLMNKQNGKEITPSDKKILFKLSNEYNLKPGVINVLIEHCLNKCDNRLIENYIYPIASDLHRNNVDTVNKAFARLDITNDNKKSVKKEVEEKYDASNNPKFDEERRNALRNRRGKND